MLILTVLLALHTAAGAQSAAAQYNQGNEFYRQGQFEAAREHYLQVVDQGVVDARLFYNLGNVYFKTGELGRAILWYERAWRLAPRDPDIRANLRFANAVKQDREPEVENLLWGLLTTLFFYPTLDELSLSLSFLLVCCFALAVWRLRRRTAGVGWLILLSACAVLAMLTGGYLGARLYHQQTRVEAVVIVAQGTARSGPHTDQTSVFVVHEGTKVQAPRREGDWLLVRLANGLAGWLPAAAIEFI